MFVVPAAISVVLDAVCFWVAVRAIGPTFVIVAFMGLRLTFLAMFAAVYYCERRMSLRLPLMWELVNLVLIAVKGASFLISGAPFREAWLLLVLCAASIALELVCVAHLRSSAGTLPRQHVFLHTAVGAMATMNLSKRTSDTSGSPITGCDGGTTAASARRGDGDGADGRGAFLGDEETGDEFVDSHRRSSFDDRRRFLSDWNTKVDALRVRWRSKVDELTGKLAAARRNRGWGGAEGGSGGTGSGGGSGGGGGGLLVGGEGAPLLLLARMFAQEQAAIEDLEVMWNRDPKWTEFFLPQYTLFLLYASFAHSARLQELLLGRCESSVHTAHTIYWFLRAFCLQGARVTPVGVKAIEQMLREVVGRGERPAQAFCELGWAGDGSTSRKYMELFDAPREGNGGSRSFGGCFGESPAFVDELVKISMELVEVGKERRTEELRRRLREVQAQFLPSRAIYVPVGRRRHRVYRIAVEESFSFSTKDRAPYLVTLEVLDCRQQRQQRSSSGAEQGGGALLGGLGSAAGDRAGEAGGGRGGRGKLIRMLTPKGLGQSLRDIADNTLTTLKRGVSAKEGREDDGSVDGGGGGGPEDVESHPPLTAAPGAGPLLSRSQMAAAPSDSSELSLPRRQATGGGEKEKEGVDGDSAAAAATRSNSSGSAGATTSGDSAADAGDDINPMEERSSGEAPAAAPALRLAVRPSAAAAAAAAGAAAAAAAIVSELDSGAETDSETKSEQADIAVVVREGDGMLLVEGEGRGEGAGMEPGEGGMPNDLDSGGGGGAERGAVDSVFDVEGWQRGGEEEEGGGDAVRRPIPPSFSSTNLMGMWSRPSKRVPEVGQVSLFSPTSPHQIFFKNTPSTVDSRSSSSSINGTRTTAAAAAAAAVAAAAVAASALSSTVGAATEAEARLLLDPDAPALGDRSKGDGDFGTDGEGGFDSAGGSPLSVVGGASPERSTGVGSSATAAVAGTPVTPSPGIFSAAVASEEAEALLLPSQRNATPGSARLEGYGAASEAPAAASPAGSPAAPAVQARTRSPSPSPSPAATRRNSNRRSGGYTELRSQGSHGRGGGGYEDDEDDDDEDDDGDGDAGSAPPKVIFKERWRQKEARLRTASKLGQAREWRLLPVIVKAGDDLRQEQLASQFFALAHRILKQSLLHSRAGLRPYDIVATSHDAGIIEAIPDTVSIDALKKNDPLYTNLSDFFHRHFGPPDSEGFQRARRCFVESLAANCIVTYLLQVKDRHNGNILLDARGRVIHIDFGFMLANSPGGNFNFESAPFKLTAEFVDLMDGPTSTCFRGFRELCVQTFMELRRKMPRLILHLETSAVGNAHLPCFGGRPETVVDELRARFKPEAHDRAAMAHVHALIDRSMGCWRTSWYDLYQNYAVGIAM
ncbi:unnamed protein product [Pylaiella littoralis]